MRDTIDAGRLKDLRARKGFSQAKLSDVTKVSKRRIVALEAGAGQKKANLSTIKKLANALGVSPRVLTGEIDIPSNYDPRSDEPWGMALQVEVNPQTRLNYDLIERRYNVSPQWLYDHAPLFLALLAAQSFEWRRSRLQAAQAAHSELLAQASALSDVASLDQVAEALELEAAALEARDLLTPSRAAREHHNTQARVFEKSNRFTDFLFSLVKGEGEAGDVTLTSGFGRLGYLASQETFIQACGAKEADPVSPAAEALRAGDVRLCDIPSELWEPGREDARREWIEARLQTPAERFRAAGEFTHVSSRGAL